MTPERALQDVNGVELADSWWDWINWNYLGYQGPGKNPDRGNSFVSDRNAGIWKPVYLKVAGDGGARPRRRQHRTAAAANRFRAADRSHHRAQLLDPAGARRAAGHDHPCRQAEHRRRAAGDAVARRATRNHASAPTSSTSLTVANPDLWWPYTLGKPDLYDLRLEFEQFGQVIRRVDLRFGIRTVSQHRDSDGDFPDLGKGGNFYLTVNGRDFLVRGAAYTPDLLYDYDPDREDAILRYVKDLGLNMLRLEGKFPGEHIVEKADELGIPLMFGWMCCNQWEKWSQWDDEDRRVAAGQPAVADPDASLAPVGVHLGQRQRRQAARRGAREIP